MDRNVFKLGLIYILLTVLNLLFYSLTIIISKTSIVTLRISSVCKNIRTLKGYIVFILKWD